MKTKDQRRSRRFDSLNLLHYKVLDARDRQLGDGMGLTLNVSEGGILLETNTCFEKGQQICVTIGLEEESVDVQGVIVHCKPSDKDGMYSSGIRFENLNADGARVLEKYLTLFKSTIE